MRLLATAVAFSFCLCGVHAADGDTPTPAIFKCAYKNLPSATLESWKLEVLPSIGTGALQEANRTVEVAAAKCAGDGDIGSEEMSMIKAYAMAYAIGRDAKRWLGRKNVSMINLYYFKNREDLLKLEKPAELDVQYLFEQPLKLNRRLTYDSRIRIAKIYLLGLILQEKKKRQFSSR